MMPTLAPVLLVESITAEQAALANWRFNCEALVQTQPTVVELLIGVESDHQWIYARDGSITAMQSNGRWWADCSVPLLASRALLKSLEEGSVGSCLLDAPNAGMLRAARERMGSLAVLFVVQPDLQILRMILSCYDFSQQILEHRIWFTTGDEWAGQFRQLLSEHPGLATPTRFIRTRLSADDTINPMIADAQLVISDILSDRGAMIAAIKTQPRERIDSQHILQIGGSAFRLWDFGTEILQQQLGGLICHQLDTDDALCTSPVGLLNAVKNCGSIVTSNLCRVDSNQLVDLEVPWISWITQPNVPLFETAGARDGLVLADGAWRALARKAGWPEDRVRVCGWPGLEMESNAGQTQSVLGFICDTQKIRIPLAVKDFSSHRLLWDLIEEELSADPLVVEDIDAYLTDRAQQLNIKVEALDWRAFVENLILPAYQQGLARLLMAAGVPISIFGKGWMDLPEFVGCSGGELLDRDSFEKAIQGCSGLVYCWPARAAHAIDSVGKPVVYRAGRDSAQFIRNAKRALAGSGRRAPVSAVSDSSLRKAILELLH